MNARNMKRHAAVPGCAGALATVLLAGGCAQIIGIEDLPPLSEPILLAQHAYGKASNVDGGEGFGYSVALSEDTLALGAPYEDSAATGPNGNQDDDSASKSGAVYVFRRTASSWQQEAYLKASNTGGSDQFGWSVALAGDTLAVGARFEDSAATGADGNQGDDSAPYSGAVYVFRRTGSSWQQEAYLKASNTGAADEFGWSVALSGDTLAVGARFEGSAATGADGNQDDDSASESGAVYVFRRSGTAWRQEAYLKASNTDAYDSFGHSVALLRDSLAVGAPHEGSAATLDSGAVYVFRRTGTVWQQENYLKASNTCTAGHFGMSVALSGDTLVVGASGSDSAATRLGGNQSAERATRSGAAYVFRYIGVGWQQEACFTASNIGDEDLFGHSVALSGDLLAVGAPHEDSSATGPGGNQADDSAPESGAVYVFRRTGLAWEQQTYLKASNTGASDRFGESVALSEDTLAVGAPDEDSAAMGVNGNQDNDTATDSGAVYIFH